MMSHQYASYSSVEAMDLYIEFMQIPDNRISFEVPNDFIITSEFMDSMILAAYNANEPINPVA